MPKLPIINARSLMIIQSLQLYTENSNQYEAYETILKKAHKSSLECKASTRIPQAGPSGGASLHSLRPVSFQVR